jgi:predicted TIM-barrel fold metal-dependent hydrolase
MASRFPLFDRSALSIKPLQQRRHDLTVDRVLALVPVEVSYRELAEVALRIREAREKKAQVVLMMGAHVLRSGVQRYVIDLMERGLITAVAGNGACAIHDYEMALIGATTESVARYIQEGQFGLWRETGRLNDVIAVAAREGLGLGEALGREIAQGVYPRKDISILAAASRLGIPFTIHVGIGYDILHEHPNCNGAAVGAASYTDFLIFAKVLENLARGVVMTFGSAVMAPEVFLKALAMVRNVAVQRGRKVSDFTTLVCDLHDLPSNYRHEAARSSPSYYFRPWKTMLVRTVADGGTSYYVKGHHADTIAQLWTASQRGQAD